MSEYPMVEQVNLLIGNRLAAGGELFLPGVGSLFTERRSARRISKRMVEPPCRFVSFSSQQRGEPLPQLIARVVPCDGDAAQNIYERWLEQVLRDGVLTVGGVGMLRLKHFTPEDAFDARLNPQGRTPVRLRPLRRFDWALWCGIAAIVFAAIFGGYQFLMLYPDQPVQPDALAQMQNAPQGLAAGGVAGQHADSLACMAESGALSENTVADALPDGSAPGSDLLASDAQDASPAELPRPQVGTGSPAVQQPTTVAGADGARAVQAVTEAGSDEPASLVSGRKYVVSGVFSTPENAARAISGVVAKQPGLRCRVYRFGDKYMVSPFESDDADACARFIREQDGRFPGMWTYTAR